MAWAFGCVAAVAGTLLSCAGSLSDPPLSTNDSGGATEPVRDVDGASAPLPAKHAPSGAAVIATLHTRDSELTIFSEGGSMRYALVDASGEAMSLTLDQLRAYDANLFEVVTEATARRQPAAVLPGSASPIGRAPVAGTPAEPERKGGGFVDARLDRPTRSRASGAPEGLRGERNAPFIPLRD